MEREMKYPTYMNPMCICGYLEVLGLDDVDGEPGDGGVEADREQDLRQVRLNRVHVALKVGGQILKNK